VTGGMSYRDAADALNARFGTAYSRSAALGRARRMGLAEIERPKPLPRMTEAQLQQVARARPDEVVSPNLVRHRPALLRPEGVQLRCVEIAPRHLAVIELEADDCRYPYGGEEEGDSITFCGHPRRKGSSYCTPHFHLTRNPEVSAERVPSVIPLRSIATV
jgi:GcrA cell cycle regulator